jgi:hypothetical protein
MESLSLSAISLAQLLSLPWFLKGLFCSSSSFQNLSLLIIFVSFSSTALWAPLIDGFFTRLSWIIPLQALMVALSFVCSLAVPETPLGERNVEGVNFPLLFASLFFCNFFAGTFFFLLSTLLHLSTLLLSVVRAATQDVAVDALAMDILTHHPHLLSYFNICQVVGYKVFLRPLFFPF